MEPVALAAMDSNLEDILQESGVDPARANQIVADGWTVSTFACCTLDLQDFEKAMDEMWTSKLDLIGYFWIFAQVPPDHFLQHACGNITVHFHLVSFSILPWTYWTIRHMNNFLRICSSGNVAYAGASPRCGQYSRLTLRTGGPPPVRTPDHLNGVPGIAPSELLKVPENHTMLSRCLQCLVLVFQAGGHAHLEQPPSAMSWLEPEVQDFLRLIGALCINLPTCAFGWNIYQTWMLATSFSALQSMGAISDHAQDSHESIAGPFNAAGDFFEQRTACYPASLDDKFAEIIDPLLSDHAGDLPWSIPNNVFPIIAYDAFPMSSEVGGGLFSVPVWSPNNRQALDSLHQLRITWRQTIWDPRLDRQLLVYVA
eukprot:s2135_g5.t1